MTITAQQITDLRADIGDEGETAFSDAEISRIWDRVSGASSTNEQHEAALALMARQLMSNAAKLADYSAGETSEKRSQIFKHLKMLYDMYKDSLERATGTQVRQFARRSVRVKPRQDREYPAEFDEDDGDGILSGGV